MNTNIKSWLPWIKALAPTFSFAFTYGVYRLYFIEANIHKMDIGVGVGDLIEKTGTLQATYQFGVARLSWAVTGTIFLLTFISATILLGKIILERKNLSIPLEGRAAGLIAIVLAVVAGIFAHEDNPFTTAAFEPVLIQTFENLNMLPVGEYLLFLMIPMVVAVIVWLLFAALTILISEPASKTDYAKVCHLRLQFRNLNTILFVGAAVLVIGIVHASSLHRMPIGFLNEDVANHLDQLVNVLSASTGAVWTLLLLSIYLPSILILRNRARKLAEGSGSAKGPDEITTWLSKNGLVIELPQKLARIAAILSPLIVGGPAAPLLQLLTG